MTGASMNGGAPARLKVTCDVGGTFTDVVVAEAAGRLAIGKALTTPGRLVDGLRAAIEAAGAQLGHTLEGLLADTDVLIYATTRSTNAILTQTTARTALITTAGFGDTLVFREGGKLRPFDFREPYPEPYIPKRLTWEVAERVDSEGEVVVALDAEEVDRVLAELAEHHVEAVAVSLLWSIANPVHEQLIGDRLEARLPGVPYTLSHRLNPIVREYRRAGRRPCRTGGAS